jgi:hypothetical protein
MPFTSLLILVMLLSVITHSIHRGIVHKHEMLR